MAASDSRSADGRAQPGHEYGHGGSDADNHRHDLQRPAHSQVTHDQGRQEELHQERGDVQIEAVEAAQERRQILLVAEGRLGHGAELKLHHDVDDEGDDDDRHDHLQVPVAADAYDDVAKGEVLVRFRRRAPREG